MTRVYISSSFRDLKVHRAEVYKALRRMGLDVVAMEDMTASHRRPLAASLADVESCEIYIGIFAWRYGFIPTQDNPEDKSITELELRHAEKKGKTCLIFLLDENAPWLPAFIDRGEAGDAIGRLRAELQDRFTCDFFDSPEDLAAKVATAVSRALATTPPRPPDPEPKRERKFGPIVPKKCDRHDQGNEFAEFFDESTANCPGRPKFIIIHGDISERHLSLVERFKELHVQPYADGLAGGPQGAVPLKKLPDWPLRGEVEWRFLQVLTGLFREWGAKLSTKKTPEAAGQFGRLIAASPARVLAFRHNLYLQKLDATTVEAIKKYMEFWGMVAAGQPIPEVFIFLNVIYQLAPEGGGFSFGSLALPMRHAAKLYFKWVLGNACGRRSPSAVGGCPSVLLTELSCVKQKDVWVWFEEHDIDRPDVPGFRQGEIQSIFKTPEGKLAGCRSMSDVEPHLYRIIKKFEPEVGSI